MRLLRISDRELLWRHEIEGNAEYAILSHKWLKGNDKEVVFDEIPKLEHIRTRADKARSVRKFDEFCRIAREDGFQYVWLDTCCIDQKNAVEVQTSINSMFHWYQEAAVCYIYLAEFDSRLSNDPTNDVWFTRGWTLQEFIAPKNIKVFDKDWNCVGVFRDLPGDKPEKSPIMDMIYEKTHINKNRLKEDGSLHQFSVAHRMSWYRGRTTGVPEDNAYCLMGIFSVNMPLLYGEGAERAFRRLQEEIMKNSDDHSLFAWRAPPDSIQQVFGLLAPSPQCFDHSSLYEFHASRRNKRPYAMTNKGLEIDLYIMQIASGLYVATLDCQDPESGNHLSVYLQRLNDRTDQYARVNATKRLPLVETPGGLKPVFVKQPL